MEKGEILTQWKSRRKNKQADVALWNSMAEGFGRDELPQFSADSFLQLLQERGMFDSRSEVLDVGCGTGSYALALAGRCNQVTGVDFSPEMIRIAGEKAAEHSVSNVVFRCGDWAELELESLGSEGRFDLVFAHMTPAVQSADTFLKLSGASRGWCAVSKPTHRTDPVSDAVRELVGITGPRETGDQDICYAFSLLWQDGLLPELRYERQHWHMRKTPQEAAGLYVNRMKTERDLSDEEEQRILRYLKSIEQNGMVCEDVDTIVTTIFWHV